MTTKEFIEKVVRDQAVQEKIGTCTSPEEAYNYAKSEGLTDSFEQFSKTMREVREASLQMTDKDIENVTGGSDVSKIVTMSAAASAMEVSVVTASFAAACGL